MARNCTNCGEILTPGGRFCGGCGNPTPTAQPTPTTPDGNATVIRSGPADELDTATVLRSSIPGLGKDRTVPPPADAPGSGSGGAALPGLVVPGLGSPHWTAGVRVAALALAPIIILGALGGIYLTIAADLSPLTVLAGIGLVSSLAFGGRITVGGTFAEMGSADPGSFEILLYPLLLPLACGIILYYLLRAHLRSTPDDSAISSTRRVAPAVGLFAGFASLMTVLLSLVTTDTKGHGITDGIMQVSGSLGFTFAGAVIVAVTAAAVACAIHERGQATMWGQVHERLSVPLYSAAVLLAVVSVLAFTASSAFGFIQGNHASSVAWGTLGGLLILPNVGLLALSGGVFATGTLEGPYWALNGFKESNYNWDFITDQLSGTVTSLTAMSPWGWAWPLTANLLGILAAVVLVLRRRRQESLLRDGAAFILMWAVVGFLSLVFVRVAVAWDPSGPFVAYAYDQAGGDYGYGDEAVQLLAEGGWTSGIGGQVLILLPLFSALWWVIAAWVTPRLPLGVIAAVDKVALFRKPAQ